MRIAATGYCTAASIFSGSAPASTIRSPPGAWTMYELTSNPPMSRRTCSISVNGNLLAFVGRGERGAVPGDPAHVVDVGDRPYLAYDLLDVRDARRLEGEPAQRCPVLNGIDARRQDVYPGIGDRRRHVLQEVHPVQRLHQYLHRKQPLRDRKSV